jgi:hypothetical protein
MVWTLVVANIIAVIVCLIFLKQICSITRVPVHRLVPFLLLFIAIGAFTATNSWNDVMVMLVVGFSAVFAGRWGWPLPPMLLGLVLGPMIESNYFLSYELDDESFSWLGRPIVVVLIAVLVLSMGAPYLKRWIDRRARRSVAGDKAGGDDAASAVPASRIRVVFSAATLAVALIVIWQMQLSGDIPLRTKQFPLLAAVPMALLSAYQLIVDLRSWRGSPAAPADDEPVGGVGPTRRSHAPDGQGVAVLEHAVKDDVTAFAREEASTITRRAVLAFSLFFVCQYVCGFMVGMPLFAAAYLLFIARVRWYYALLGAAATYGFLWLLFVQIAPIPLMPSQVFGW